MLSFRSWTLPQKIRKFYLFHLFRLLKGKVILVLLKERVTFLLSKTFDTFIYFKKSKYFFFPRKSVVVSKSNKLNCHSLSKKSHLTFESRNGEEVSIDSIKFCYNFLTLASTRKRKFMIC